MSRRALHHHPDAASGGCACDGCTGHADPRPDEFDPADTARRVADALTGMVWHSVTRGDWTIVSAEPLRFQWPIAVRILVAGSPWPVPQGFEVDFGWEDAFPCASPGENARGLAGDAMILVEEYVETGPVARLTELSANG